MRRLVSGHGLNRAAPEQNTRASAPEGGLSRLRLQADLCVYGSEEIKNGQAWSTRAHGVLGFFCASFASLICTIALTCSARWCLATYQSLIRSSISPISVCASP